MYTLFFIIAHCYALRLGGTKKFWSENGHIDWWKDEWIDGQIKTQDDEFNDEWIYGLRVWQIDRPVDGWIDKQTDRQITKK